MISVSWRTERVEGAALDLDEVLAVYRSCALAGRWPVADRNRFARMLRSANLVIAARSSERLIGVARSLSDFSYVTYLSDIAVARNYQRAGVGRALVEATRLAAPEAAIVLLGAPMASGYYPRLGFTPHNSAWVHSF